MMRLVAVALLLLSGNLCWGLSFYTIEIVKSSDGYKYMVRGKALPVGALAEQLAKHRLLGGTDAFVRIQVAADIPVESLFPVLTVLRTSGIRRCSIRTSKDRNGDGVIDFREHMEAVLTIDNVLTNGCLEGEHWGYRDGSSGKQAEQNQEPTNKPPDHTR